MSVNEAKTAILNNKTALGIEFGSTRIKAVLVDEKYNPIASGSYEWENRYENGVWTYSLDDIHKGLQGSYSDLVKDVQEKYGVELTSVGALGISAMMHGYMPFDKEGNLLVPFRTWRNNITGEASEKLMELFQYNILGLKVASSFNRISYSLRMSSVSPGTINSSNELRSM